MRTTRRVPVRFRPKADVDWEPPEEWGSTEDWRNKPRQSNSCTSAVDVQREHNIEAIISSLRGTDGAQLGPIRKLAHARRFAAFVPSFCQ